MDSLFAIFDQGRINLSTLVGEQRLANLSQVSNGVASIAYEAHSSLTSHFSNGVLCDGNTILGLSGFALVDQNPVNLLEICQLYAESGQEGLYKLRGAFILILHDGSKGLVIRDGAGQRTCYFSQLANQLLIAPQPKFIHRIPQFDRSLHVSALAQYLSFSFVPGKDTMLNHLYEVPPGNRLSWCRTNWNLSRFYRFEMQQQKDLSESQWVEYFQSEFSKAVARRLPQKQSVGVFLSGGLDSSIVTAELAMQVNKPLFTYSLHFGPKYNHELEFANAVAEHLKTEHRQILIKPKYFLQKLRKIVWQLDDPIGDPITIPNYELAQVAKQEVDWIFNGEGGDPCFGGPKNYGMLISHWYGQNRQSQYFREEAYLQSFKRAYEEIDYLLLPDIRRQIDRETHLYKVLTPYFEAEQPKHFLNKLMAMNIRLKGAHLILPKVERMLGANGLVSMSPLFDDRLVDFSFQIPPKLKVSFGDEKRVLKMAYADKIPSQVITRPKSGMRVPVHFWFQKEMRRYVRHIFSEKEVKRAGIFNPIRIKELLHYNVQQNNKRCGLKLWMLMSFEIWRRLVLEGESL